jgi:SAM-dependent methyltransferase
MKLNIFNLLELHIKKVRKKSTKDDWYKADYIQFVKIIGDNTDFPITPNYPCLNDKDVDSGVAKGAYFHQDMFVAKQIYINTPKKHVDIGSRIDGFIAHVAVFRPVEIFDIRSLDSKVENISFIQADLMSADFSYINYCDSISSLHALEHFGLGRYGDQLDPIGHLKGFENITKMLKQGGTFYFSVPMGVQRIEFNAHRIFNLHYLLNWVSKDFTIVSFSYINDLGDFYENIELTEQAISSTFNCNHGCAVFVLSKK